MVLLLAAGFGMDVGVQEPGFDLQFAVPVADQTIPAINTAPQQATAGTAVSTTSPEVTYQVAAAVAQQGRRVSAQFSSVKPSEVFDWLQKQGVSFVVADGSVPADAKVTLNVVDQPVDDVIDALGRALGGHWGRQNGIRVFERGVDMMPMIATTPMNGQVFNFDSKNLKFMEPKMAEEMAKMGEKMKGFAGKDGQTFTWSDKDMQKAFGPDFQAHMKKMAEQWSKNGQNMDMDKFKFDEKEFKKEFGPEFQEHMKKMAQEMSKNGQQMKIFMDKNGDFQKELEKFRTEAAKDGDAVRIYSLKDGKMRAEIEKAHAEGMKAHMEAMKALERGKAYTFKNGKLTETRILSRARAASAASGNIKKLMDSLTADQKNDLRTRGYIFYVDLTPAQKKLLGDVPKGNFEMKFKVNDQWLTIHGS
jgi:hypothetical protein